MGWEVVEAQVLGQRLIWWPSSILILFSIFFFFFLTLVHPFLPLFFLLARVWEKWGEDEWSWGFGVGKYLPLVQTCGPCPIVNDNSLTTQSVVFACLSDGPIQVTNRPVLFEFAYPGSGTWSRDSWIHLKLAVTYSFFLVDKTSWADSLDWYPSTVVGQLTLVD